MALTPCSETSETQKRVHSGWPVLAIAKRLCGNYTRGKRALFELKRHGSVTVLDNTSSIKDVGTILYRKHWKFSKQDDASLSPMCSVANGVTRVGFTLMLLQLALVTAVCKAARHHFHRRNAKLPDHSPSPDNPSVSLCHSGFHRSISNWEVTISSR